MEEPTNNSPHLQYCLLSTAPTSMALMQLSLASTLSCISRSHAGEAQGLGKLGLLLTGQTALHAPSKDKWVSG